MSIFPLLTLSILRMGDLSIFWRLLLSFQRESRQPWLVPDFNWSASSFSPFNLMLAIGLLNIAFIMFHYGHWISDISKIYNKYGCCILSKAFFKQLMRWSFGIFFEFVDTVYYVDGILYIDPSPASLGWTILDHDQRSFWCGPGFCLVVLLNPSGLDLFLFFVFWLGDCNDCFYLFCDLGTV